MIRSIRVLPLCLLLLATGLALGCHSSSPPQPSQPTVQYFKVDPATAGTIQGTIHFDGRKPAPKLIDMSSDPACVDAHKGKAYDESLVNTLQKGMMTDISGSGYVKVMMGSEVEAL